MSPTPHTQRSRGRVAAVIAGAGAMLVAVAVLAVGGATLRADSHRGHDGYVSTGNRTPPPPAKRHFWVATAYGRGTQAVSWKLKPGHWEAVVMNADGTPGVDAAVRLGAHTPLLLVPGLGLVVLGMLIGAGGFALLYRGTRSVETVAPPVPVVA